MTANTLVDGFISLEGGCDTGRVPTLLARNQTSLAVNTSTRGGFIQQRPGFVIRLMDYDDPSYAAVFATWTFACAHVYQDTTGKVCIVILIGARLFVCYPTESYRLREVTPPTGSDDWNPLVMDGWMVQAGPYLVVQNGEGKPIIFNGSSARFARAGEIKCGRAMAFVQGRIWYALPDGYSFRATDLIYGDGTVESVLKETENDFLNEGGDFSVPRGTGPITAMVAPGNLDTSMGQGPLQVFTEQAVYSVNTPVDRTVWKDVSYPIQTVSQVNFGALSPRGVVVVNGDIFYRASDGIRSFRLARRDFQSWGNVPASKEMSYILDNDATNFLGQTSGVVWHNRLIMTCSPRYSDSGIRHRGLVAMDLDPIGSMTSSAPPAWQGLWTGLEVMQILTGRFAGVDRCFLLARDRLAATEKTELWELVEEETSDVNRGGDNPIEWSFETPAYAFGDPFTYKRLGGAEVYIDKMSGTAVFDFDFRTDGYPGWIDWHSWTDCGTVIQCDPASGCLSLLNLQPQHRPRVTLPQPPETCDSVARKPLRDFWTVQAKVAVTGAARIRSFRMQSEPLPVTPFECPVDTACSTLNVCVGSPFGYQADT